MAIDYYSPINLNKNELQNPVVHNLASAPSSPVEGQLYYDTATHTLYVRNNTTWVAIGTATGITALTGDVTASGSGSVAATVATVGGASAVNIADAVTKRHTQNTDTGTTQTSFNIDSGGTGVKLKNNAGVLELRNLADSSYADLKVNNIYVLGEVDTVSSTTIYTGDAYLQLQNDVATNGAMIDAGIQVKRIDTDNSTRRDAKLTWNESSNGWQQTTAKSDGTMATFDLPRKYAVAVGDGSTTSIVVTHNMNTRDVVVNVYENSGSYNRIEVNIQATSVDTITLVFSTAPTTNQFKVVVIG